MTRGEGQRAQQSGVKGIRADSDDRVCEEDLHEADIDPNSSHRSQRQNQPSVPMGAPLMGVGGHATPATGASVSTLNASGIGGLPSSGAVAGGLSGPSIPAGGLSGTLPIGGRGGLGALTGGSPTIGAGSVGTSAAGTSSIPDSPHGAGVSPHSLATAAKTWDELSGQMKTLQDKAAEQALSPEGFGFIPLNEERYTETKSKLETSMITGSQEFANIADRLISNAHAYHEQEENAKQKISGMGEVR